MAVANRRDRAVVFRMTQEEYDALRAVSATSGARNVSDFVRSTILASIETSGITRPESLTELSQTLASLKDVVGRVAEKMDQISPEDLSARQVKK